MRRSVVVVVIVSALKGSEAMQFTADNFNSYLTSNLSVLAHDVP